MSDLEPLSRDALAALAEEREVREDDPGLQGRVLTRLQSVLGPSLGFGPGKGGPSGSGGGDAGGGSKGGPAAPKPGSGGAAARGAATASAKILGAVVTSFLVGAGVGITVDRAVSRAPAASAPMASTGAAAPPPATEVAAQLAATATSAEPTSVPLDPREKSVRLETPAPPQTNRNEGDAPGGLAKERALIDVARAGVARGHPEAALEALRRHEQLFPNGALREEREGLRVLALVADYRGDEARGQAERFRKKYPDSVLLPTIDSAEPTH